MSGSHGDNLLPRDGFAVVRTDLLRPEEADALLARLLAELDWAQETAHLFGRHIPLPRLTAWYGPSPYRYSGVAHPARPLPPVLADLAGRLTGDDDGPNSVLANLYRDGRDSMSWHSDDEPEFGPDPTIWSVSLGAARRFAFRHRRTGERQRLVLPHGSLLVMGGACQRSWHHAVPKTVAAVDPRVNLTFRRMLPAAEVL